MGEMIPEPACNATALRKASRRLTQLYDDALGPCGLRSTQYAILAEVGRRGDDPPTMRELAEALVLDRSALGHNVRPLERDGWLALAASSADRRRRHVVLTPAGSAILDEARPRWQAAQRQFEAALGADEAARLRSILTSIAQNEQLARLAPAGR
jgi:DNA-binding MarR family transcriptional regulator